MNKRKFYKLMSHIMDCMKKYPLGSKITINHEVENTSLGEYVPRAEPTGWKEIIIRYYDPEEK